MNREQRRRQAKEERRNLNSKRNFVSGGYKVISIEQLQHDENLKECDKALLDLMSRAYDWKIKNNAANNIISEGLRYLDSLCSLRFDITPIEDRMVVRDTMHFLSDTVNMFLGLYYTHNKEKTVGELMKEALSKGEISIPLPIPQHKDIAPMYGDVMALPSRDKVDDIYAEFVVAHANDLANALYDTKYSEVSGDEVQIFEVLLFISKKTMQLLPEADVA